MLEIGGKGRYFPAISAVRFFLIYGYFFFFFLIFVSYLMFLEAKWRIIGHLVGEMDEPESAWIQSLQSKEKNIS